MSRPLPTAGGTDRIDRFLAFGANGLGGMNGNIAVLDTNDATFLFSSGSVDDE